MTAQHVHNFPEADPTMCQECGTEVCPDCRVDLPYPGGPHPEPVCWLR